MVIYRLWAMSFVLFLGSFTLAYCGVKGGGARECPAEVQPYVDSFYAEAGRRGRVATEVEVRWDDLKKMDSRTTAILGECDKSTGIIFLDTERWKTLDDGSREALVFHEMGHCALGLNHSTNPKSLMYPNLPWPETYKKYREEMVDNLFRGV